jgi:hypothetical protein
VSLHQPESIRVEWRLTKRNAGEGRIFDLAAKCIELLAGRLELAA